jgi:AraC family transcriptional regulator, regulatory protein of adaptative response / methylated-DNA-[protein]-cysteine methyltransferase
MQVFSNFPNASDARLTAVMARDRRADGSFVYGVSSTGIFCRPSCASRRPRVDRIAFFSTPASAKAAGYRACLRCQPEQTPESTDVVQRVCRFIDTRTDGAPSLSELAREFSMSRHHLARVFKAAVGMTPKAYGDLRRVERLKQRLRTGDSVTGAMYDAGYGSSSRLYERGTSLLGMTPSTYRKRGHGTSASFTIVRTSFGKLLVAATERGVCAVTLGDSDAALERTLHREFGLAELQRDDAALAPVVNRIVRHIEDGTPLGHLETDVKATAFTRAVWKALAAIPRGQTRTYGEIAAKVGRPTAARAVAQACASNRLALVIPCHRVVPASGGVGGYRWGAARKRKLLERERAS